MVYAWFTRREGKGFLKGICGARPSVWKRDIGVTADKLSSRLRAKALFPFQRKLLTSEGKCEAALIALYGLHLEPQLHIERVYIEPFSLTH